MTPAGLPPVPEDRAIRLFRAATARPRLLIVLTLLVIAGLCSFVPRLERDTRNRAYSPEDHPGLVANDLVKEQFGRTDDTTVLVAVIRRGPLGVFDPNTLRLVAWLTDRIEALDGVDPDGMRSLSTVKSLTGTADGMLVERFLEHPVETEQDARRVRDAVMGVDLYVGTLVSQAGDATLITAELTDEAYGAPVYYAILEMLDEAPIAGEEVHLAGLGAYNAVSGEIVSRDAARLNPIAGLIVIAMLFVSYRTLRGVLVPLVALTAAVAASFGTMGAFGFKVYSITTSLGVILIAVAVCDGIHIMGAYYRQVAADPRADSRTIVTRCFAEVWQPVVWTSVTTLSGFLALSVSSSFPPMQQYGLFAALGALAALLCCLFLVPSILILLKPRGSSAYRGEQGPQAGVANDLFGRSLLRVGRFVLQAPLPVVLAGGLSIAIAAAGALRLEQNNEYKAFLSPAQPLHQAEVAINSTLGGIQSLDVVVDFEREGALLEPENLRVLERIQGFLRDLPQVKGTLSIVDQVKQMNVAMNENRRSAYALPDDPELIAQYFLVYSGEPTDFEGMVDSEFRRGLIRASFGRARWSDSRVAVPAVERFLASENHREGGPEIRIAGLVNMGYHLDHELFVSQTVGVSLTLVVVWLACAAAFRSAQAGLFAMLPVGLGMLFVYGVMGYLGIWLSLATSMTGAIAIGIGVDFAIHTVDRLVAMLRDERRSFRDAFEEFYPSTGRALLFNFAALLTGFSVLLTSEMPPVRLFGILVVVCVSTSFVASVTLLPALAIVLRPRFLRPPAS